MSHSSKKSQNPSKPVKPIFLSGYRPHLNWPSAPSLKMITVFYWIFICAVFVPDLWRVYETGDWVKTPCVIKASWVSGKERAYLVKVRFSYHDSSGQKYIRERYSFGQRSSKTKAPKQKIVEALPKGSTNYCFVDPDNPGNATFRMEHNISYGLLTLLLLVGILAILFIRWREFQRPKSQLHFDYWKEVMSDLRPFDAENAGHGPKTTLAPYRPEKSWLAFLGCWLIALVGWAMVDVLELFGESSKTALMILGIVATPVVLGLLYFYAKLRNPIPEINVPDPIRQAIPFTLDWRFPDKSKRPDYFHIRLEGREKIWRGPAAAMGYSKQNTFSKKTKVFQIIPLYSAKSRPSSHNASEEAIIPPETMHSLDGHRNAILWKVIVESKTGLLPKLIREYSITVLPTAYNGGNAL